MAVPDNAFDIVPVLDAGEVAGQIRDGDLFLCAGTAAFSRLIRWATKSAWSHVATAMRADEAGRALLLESVEKIGVRTTSFRTFVFGRDGRHPYPGRILWARNRRIAAAPPEAITAMLGFAIDQLGDPFHGAEILRIALRILHGSTNRKTPEFLKAQNEYICSEYVDACFQKAGVKTPWDGRGFIAPCDFAAAPDCEALAEIRTIHTPTNR